MSGSKYFDRIAWIAAALTLVLTILFMNGAALGIRVAAHAMGYEERLFDHTKVHTVDIVMNDWEDFITNAVSEEYYAADVVIDGEACKNVGIRAKGNTSLSTVASLGSERYSFKIEFDHYDSAKSYHGLDKLSLNNLIQDSTMMKDYLTYTMMQAFGVNSSLCSYVYITVNGEDWGLYLAVEGVEDAFLNRNYGSDHGKLYKPDSMNFGGGRGNGMDFDMDNFDFNSDEEQTDSSGSGSTSGESKPSSMPGNGGRLDMPSPGGTEIPGMPSPGGAEIPGMPSPGDSEMPEGFDSSATPGKGDGENGSSRSGGGLRKESSDVKLQYIDDNLDSYSNIWNSAKTDITKADQNRLIESLKELSDGGGDKESVVDMEQVIRYFVVHNYVCNDDSYTGMMVHNYYLYEEDGRLAMIPWDYNLAFGTFGGGDATSTVNTPIDSPVSGGSSDRPMLNWIFENEKYTALYHQYFSEFIETVDIAGIIEDAYHLVRSYVEKDPTAFYTYEEFESGVETLRQFCNLRSESISMQIENGETSDNINYVNASAINLSDMGSMGGGRGDTPPDMPDGSTGNRPDDFDSSNMPDGFNPSDLPDDFSGDFPGQPSGNPTETAPFGGSDTSGDAGTNRPSGGNRQTPDGDFPFGMNEANAPSSNPAGWIWIAVSAVILAAGLITAKKYKS